MKFYSDVNLQQNQVKKLVLEQVNSFPANSKYGRLIYHTSFNDSFICVDESDTTRKGAWKSLSTTTIEQLQNTEQIGKILMTDGNGGFIYTTVDGGQI